MRLIMRMILCVNPVTLRHYFLFRRYKCAILRRELLNTPLF